MQTSLRNTPLNDTRSSHPIAPLVLFDLDGTLVDTAADLAVAIDRTLADYGRPPLPIDTIRPVVSKGGRAMLAVAFADLDADAREALLQPFLTHYASAIAVRSAPFPGVPGTLAAIEAAGARWGIVTNKAETLARSLIEALGWSRRCAVLIGGDTLPLRKPDPAPLLEAARRVGVEVRDCVYVGDDERDIVAARAAGMRSVAALWGYREAHENPATWRADALAADAHALLARHLLRVDNGLRERV